MKGRTMKPRKRAVTLEQAQETAVELICEAAELNRDGTDISDEFEVMELRDNMSTFLTLIDKVRSAKSTKVVVKDILKNYSYLENRYSRKEIENMFLTTDA
jgi:hypothetical protein